MSSEYDTTHHLVVGAGICGTIVAYSYAKAGVPVVVFDREVDLGGIWNKSLSIAKVNSESRPQIDPVIFRLPEDDTLVQFITGEFGGIWSTPDRVVEQVRAMKENAGILTHLVIVRWRDLESEQIHQEKFAGLHIRTGFQQQPKPIKFLGDEDFKGIRGFGMKDDVSLEQMKGKHVVILGCGATANDNAVRALLSGAADVTLVFRHQRTFMTAYASYLINGLMSDEVVTDPNFIPSNYQKIVDALKKGWNAVDCDYMADNGCFVEIQGENHIRLQNGFDSYRSDTLLMAHKYGLLKLVQDEVSKVGEKSIELKNSGSIPCDVLFQCLGYGADKGLMKGHTIVGGFFVDGQVNVTQLIGADAVLGSKFYGPKTPEALLAAPNVFNMPLYEDITLFYLKNPDLFKEYIASPLFSSVVDVHNFDFFELLKLFPKVLFSGHACAINILVGGLVARKEARSKYLPLLKFLEFNKAEWDQMSQGFAKRTGKSFVAYPYEQEYEAAKKGASA